MGFEIEDDKDQVWGYIWRVKHNNNNSKKRKQIDKIKKQMKHLKICEEFFFSVWRFSVKN